MSAVSGCSPAMAIAIFQKQVLKKDFREYYQPTQKKIQGWE
jgi:hypothetical protein